MRWLLNCAPPTSATATRPPEPDCGGVTANAALVLSPAFASLKGRSVGMTFQPDGALRRKLPSVAARSDMISTSILLLAPGLNKAAVEPKLSATGATIAS